MIAPNVSRRFFNVLYTMRLWFVFVGFWKLYERIVPPSKHITLDGIDGGERRPYLTRWHVLPRNKWFNIYLHRFIHGDDDRALHDHPWHSASLILDGRWITDLEFDDIVRVERGPHSFRLVTVGNTNFYEAFRSKFNFRIRPDAVPSRRQAPS